MIVASSRLGEMNVSAEDFIQFPEGFPGLPDWKKAVLAPVAEVPFFFWLQFSHDPNAAFLLLALEAVLPDYDFALARATAMAGDDAAVFSIVSVPGGSLARATANLLAPVVIEPSPLCSGQQVILHDTAYPLRHLIFAEDAPC